jgi:hypothetical protein
MQLTIAVETERLQGLTVFHLDPLVPGIETAGGDRWRAQGRVRCSVKLLGQSENFGMWNSPKRCLDLTLVPILAEKIWLNYISHLHYGKLLERCKPKLFGTPTRYRSRIS